MKASRLWSRLAQHQNRERIPKPFEYKIIFRGSRKEALALEAKLRPRPYIGWNIGVGGFADGRGLRGIPRPSSLRAAISASAKLRYADPKEHERTSKAVKRGLKGVDRSGSNNSRFGAVVSEKTKQKMRDKIAERGGVAGKRNPNYRHGRRVGD